MAYVAGEAKQSTEDRLALWAQEYGQQGDNPAPLEIFRRVDLSNPATVKAFMRELQAIEREANCKFGLIIVDTFSSNTGGDENEGKDMKPVMAHLVDLAVGLDLCVVALHHPTQKAADGDAPMRISGSHKITGTVDNELKIERKGNAYVLSSGKKNRDSRLEDVQFKVKGLPFGEWEDGTAITVLLLEEQSSAQAQAEPNYPDPGKEGKQHRAFEILKAHPFGMSQADWVDAVHQEVYPASERQNGAARKCINAVLARRPACVHQEGGRFMVV